MNWKEQRIALVIGGQSAEAEVSRKGGQAISEAMSRLKLNYQVLDGLQALQRALQNNTVDCVFNLIHGEGGEDGVIQGLLESFEIPYTGSGLLSSALSMNKKMSCDLWKYHGLPVADSVLVAGQCEISTLSWNTFPAVVKPNSGGSSVGVAFVHNHQELVSACESIIKDGDCALIEEQIIGDEYTVGILGEQVLPIIKIVPATGFYDYESKYQLDNTQYICPCDLSDSIQLQIQNLALKAYQLCGCKGWGRVDLIMNRHNKPVLLEVNTTPGMTSHSLIPKAAHQAGIGFDQLVIRILESCELRREELA
ncbi:MAG: D-alanine--D-alanine ligase [bacterium]